MQSTSIALYLMLTELGIDFNKDLKERDIQRKVYLLRMLGVDFGFRHKIGYGKPASPHLMYFIYQIEHDLGEYEAEDPFINKNLNNKGKKIINKAKEIIKKAKKINLFNTGEIQFLEALILMHFLKTEVFYDGDKEQVIKEFKEFKSELKNNKKIIKELWSIIEEL
jgi:hypothetical protein